jgi:formate dehydrogenase subunit delta
MGSNVPKLVRMANQIADFFAPYPHVDQVAGVRRHLHAFWSSVMKRDLARHIKMGGEGLQPIVIEATEADIAAWSRAAPEPHSALDVRQIRNVTLP